jgi:hypothetical protein
MPASAPMFDVVVLFFLLGLVARLAKSDLRLPEAVYEVLSIYLLLAIGLKGGIELSKHPLSVLLPQVLGTMALGFLIPLALFPLLRALRFAGADSASLAAHYGSVSVVTFAVATAALDRAGVPYESHAALWVAVMEAPALVAGILLARLSRLHEVRWGALAHEVLVGKSVLLLAGGLAIGAIAGVEGSASIAPVFIEPFRGVLALFLLELGLVAGGRLRELGPFGPRLALIGLGFPLLLACAGAGLGLLLDVSVGGTALLATLAASASYIAAPTAMRMAVPEANAALSITAALGITFPFNVLVGIPLYIQLAQWLGGSS